MGMSESYMTHKRFSLINAKRLLVLGLSLTALIATTTIFAEEGEEAVEREYTLAPSAPRTQSWDAANAKSAGCKSCHNPIDQQTMHASRAVVLGCTDCHGGDPKVNAPAGTPSASAPGHGSEGSHGKGHDYAPGYRTAMDRAHVLPKYPGAWHSPSSANPERSYTLLNREAPEFVRFMNPGDLRIAHEAWRLSPADH